MKLPLAARLTDYLVEQLIARTGASLVNSSSTLQPPAFFGTDRVPGLLDLPRTLPEVLRRAAQNDHGGAIVHLTDSAHAKVETFAELLAEAEAICGGLLRSGLKPGDRAILLLETSAETLPAFWGCLLAGITPVISQVPPTFEGTNRILEQLIHVWRLLEGPILIGGPRLIDSAAALSARLEVADVRCADLEALQEAPRATEAYSGGPGETAFFSLTSGSSGVPKSIALTHANIIQRAHGANLLCGHSPRDAILNWLPFDHIGSISDWHLRPLLLGCRMVYAGKQSVIERPLHWLEMIDEHRITHTWAPNFAYALVCERLAALRAEGQSPPPWDLSCVEGMLTAGESVSQKVVGRFLAELAPFGLRSTAIRPAFGMAELGSGVTYQVARADRPLKFCSVKRESLQGRVVQTNPDADDASTFASLGPPIPGVQIRIVDDERQIVPDETVGHVEFRGPVVSPGYFRNPEANRVFHADGWFESGDMGFLMDAELVIIGRAKETIIIRGVNYSCGEIEELVNSVPHVDPSFTAACAVRRPEADREELAVFFHTEVKDAARIAEVLQQVKQRLFRQLGVRPDFLLPVAKEAIPKTAIGKLQRAELSQRFAAGTFENVLHEVAELDRRLDGARADVAQEGIPQSEIEKQVATIWREVLGIEQIGVHDNLFDLGGDSLILAALHGRLQDRFGSRITLVEIFNYPTIHALAGFLSGGAGRCAASPAAKRVERGHGQVRLRLATMDDSERIARLEASQGLAHMPADDWRNLWLNNPLWPRLRHEWPMGWLLEDTGGRLVGSLLNVPTLYTFRGRELVCANGRGWAVTPEFRGFAPQLIYEYYNQAGAQIFINTTVGPAAAPLTSIFCDRIPLGDFQTIAFWVTGYRGFATKALQKMYGRVAGVLGDPAAAALWLKDALTARTLPAVSSSIVVEFADGFDARFDAFWNELIRQNGDKLLAVRDSRSLAWHFAPIQRAGRLWIITAARHGLLRAYAVLKRQKREDRIRRMQLVDYQTLEREEDLLPGLLQVALRRCKSENLSTLEQLGCGVPTRIAFDEYAPYRHKLKNWVFYYRAADPAIHAELARPEVWDPSEFDGDASFD